jgi:hypothetical protein
VVAKSPPQHRVAKKKKTAAKKTKPKKKPDRRRSPASEPGISISQLNFGIEKILTG